MDYNNISWTNGNASMNTTIFAHQNTHFLWIKGITFAITSVLGMLISIATLLTLLKVFNNLNTQLILISNMCISYFLYSIMVLPLDAAVQLNHGQMLDATLCRIHGYLGNALSAGMLVSLLLVTIHRYFVIIYTSSKILTFGGKAKTISIIVALNAFFYIFLFPPLFGLFGKLIS